MCCTYIHAYILLHEFTYQDALLCNGDANPVSPVLLLNSISVQDKMLKIKFHYFMITAIFLVSSKNLITLLEMLS